MIEIPFLTALILTLFAGIYDLKTSDVFEEIPFLMISFGLFYWYIISLVNYNFNYFVNSLLVGIFFLSFGLLLFKLKIWGDGDAWILGGIGFLVPNIETYSSVLPLFLPYPILAIFLILIIGGFYSLIYIFFYGLFNKNLKKNFISEFKKYKLAYLGFLFFCAILSVYIPFLVLFGFLPILYTYSKIVEKRMRRRVKTSNLKEGDVLAGNKIVGLTKKDIEKLKKSKKYVEIQEGVRFTLVFPITLIILYLLL
jgi:hypothetical protein